MSAPSPSARIAVAGRVIVKCALANGCIVVAICVGLECRPTKGRIRGSGGIALECPIAQSGVFVVVVAYFWALRAADLRKTEEDGRGDDKFGHNFHFNFSSCLIGLSAG